MRFSPRRVRLPWISFALILSCCGTPPHVPELESESVGLHSVLEAAVEDGLIAGAVGLIAVDGEVVFREAVGWKDIDEEEPMAEDTIFRIASMTKPITSAAVMMLIEEGRLDVDDPVSRFIPESKASRSSRSDPTEIALSRRRGARSRYAISWPTPPASVTGFRRRALDVALL